MQTEVSVVCIGGGSLMRTTLNLDDEALARAMEASPGDLYLEKLQGAQVYLDSLTNLRYAEEQAQAQP
jgi:hypothetical protein